MDRAARHTPTALICHLHEGDLHQLCYPSICWTHSVPEKKPINSVSLNTGQDCITYKLLGPFFLGKKLSPERPVTGKEDTCIISQLSHRKQYLHSSNQKYMKICLLHKGYSDLWLSFSSSWNNRDGRTTKPGVLYLQCHFAGCLEQNTHSFSNLAPSAWYFFRKVFGLSLKHICFAAK